MSIKCLLKFLVAGVVLANADTIQWPIPCEPAMTSAFGDFRGSHFHSGLDIRTQGKTGFPVIAEFDGYVSRIGVSARGFGTALYVNNSDGTMRVYAHLDRLDRRFQEYLREAQYSNKSYSVQLYPSQSELVFKKGDTLCFTGETGVGYPHLHYEYRNANQQTINPFVKGLRGIKDTKTPVIQSISIRPVDTSSRVDGDYAVAVYPLERGRGDTFSTVVAPKVRGRIGIGVREIDMADGAPNKFNSRILRLYANDSLVFETIRDSFYFHESRQIDIDYDLELALSGKHGAHSSLYVDNGNRLKFYGKRKEGDGILDAATAVLKIKAIDYWGNTSIGIIKISADTTDVSYKQHNVERDKNLPIGEVNVNAYRGVLLFESSNTDSFIRILTLSHLGKEVDVLLDRKVNGVWKGHLQPSFSGFGTLNITEKEGVGVWKKPVLFLAPGDSGVLKSEDEIAEVVIRTGDIIHNQAIWISPVSIPKRSGEVVFVQDFSGYELKPEAVYTEKNIEFSLKVPLLKGGGLYTSDSKGKWSFLSNAYSQSQKKYSGKIRRPSLIALGIDTVPPAIVVVEPKRNVKSFNGKKLVLRISDGGAGIGSDKSIVTYLDGNWILNEYDYESNLVTIELPDSIKRGKHSLKIIAEDLSLNVRSSTLSFIR